MQADLRADSNNLKFNDAFTLQRGLLAICVSTMFDGALVQSALRQACFVIVLDKRR